MNFLICVGIVLFIWAMSALYKSRKPSSSSSSHRAKHSASPKSTKVTDIAKNREGLENERAQKKLLVQNLARGRKADALSRGEKAFITNIEAEIHEIEMAINSKGGRQANPRAGYVYVVSNIGVFGPEIVKIGMTRRVSPLERIDQLNSASVPFKFDLHLFHYSDDAVETENKLHKYFSSRRVNLANPKKEFFYATPQEVREKLATLQGVIVEYNEKPQAIEFRQTETIRSRQLARAKHRKQV